MSMSVLVVGQDNLFANIPECSTDHISTGTSITPMAQSTPTFFLATRLLKALSRVVRTKYDLIVLPAIDLTKEFDESKAKTFLRHVIAAGLRVRFVSRFLDSILSRGNTRVIVLERYDSTKPLTPFLDCVPRAELYFKANLLRSDDQRVHLTPDGGACCFKRLPYWIEAERYLTSAIAPDSEEKDTDIFFAGTINSLARRASLEWLKAMGSAGFRIKAYEGRQLDFDEYLKLMSRSWLTLSPEGHGYNGFRHYEAMLVGSVPLINRPQSDILNDFVDGENCFLYSLEKGDLAEVARNALADKDKLRRMAKSVAQWVIEEHSPASVGRYLIRSATHSGKGKQEPSSYNKPSVRSGKKRAFCA